ncbi:MAG: hypothetical protein ACF8MJ_12850 [Phycisphaerales bacterium JB050]
MQVSSASSPAQDLLISAAKAAGRSERVVSKEALGTTRYQDRFEKALSAQESAPTYSFNTTKKTAPDTKQTPAASESNPVQPDSTDQNTAESIQFTQNDIDNLLKMFGSSEGDGTFAEQYDLDGNGTIDLQDLNAMLARMSQIDASEGSEPEPSFTQDDVDLLLESFGAQVGDENYSEALDLDGDGIIGLEDLNAMLANLSAQAQPGTYSQSHIDQLTAAFGASTGDDNFVAELDLNGDGTLNLADLNAMLASMST